MSLAKARDGEALKVLAVDDDADSRELMEEILGGCGYQVETAASGDEAIAAVERRAFDVVIADVYMPGVDGFGVLAHLRRRAPSTDVILITANGSIPDAVAATKARATYLTKGFAHNELVEELRRIAERRGIKDELDGGPEATGEAATPLVGRCPTIRQLKRDLNVIARSDGPVVICGESGTGKELVARMIHDDSPRRDKPLVTVNCAAFPEQLLEAELFGHERGAFTGASTRREGRFEAADGGSLFLDEIAEMPLVAQAKLLRVLQGGTFQRLGSNTNLRADVRIISATNKNLEELVARGEFREDLFYRIKLFRLSIAPLRERRQDIPLLVEHFCRKHAPRGAAPPVISDEVWDILRDYPFPGNVRELEYVIRHALAFSGGDEIHVEHLPEGLSGDARGEARSGEALAPAEDVRPLSDALTEFEHDYLLEVLERVQGNRSRAARMLGISRKALWAKLKRYRLRSTAAIGS